MELYVSPCDQTNDALHKQQLPSEEIKAPKVRDPSEGDRQEPPCSSSDNMQHRSYSSTETDLLTPIKCLQLEEKRYKDKLFDLLKSITGSHRSDREENIWSRCRGFVNHFEQGLLWKVLSDVAR